MKLKATLLLGLLCTAAAVSAQSDDGIMRMSEFAYPTKRAHVHIPPVNGNQVLKCDFHMHPVFADRHVWPNVPVQEAGKEGLDAISFTEHMEYTRCREDVKVG